MCLMNFNLFRTRSHRGKSGRRRRRPNRAGFSCSNHRRADHHQLNVNDARNDKTNCQSNAKLDNGLTGAQCLCLSTAAAVLKNRLDGPSKASKATSCLGSSSVAMGPASSLVSTSAVTVLQRSAVMTKQRTSLLASAKVQVKDQGISLLTTI